MKTSTKITLSCWPITFACLQTPPSYPEISYF